MESTSTEGFGDFPPARADVFELDELLSDKERDVRARVRAYAECRVWPTCAALWDAQEHPAELVAGLAELGIGGGVLPREYGAAGLTATAAGLALAELARVDGSISAIQMIHGYLVPSTIFKLGSEEQRRLYLPPLCRYEWLGAWALTEPEVGSDAGALRTIATEVHGGWMLRGRKRWIGNAPVAKVVVVWARNAATGAVNGFLVEAGDPGLRVSAMKGKIGLRCIQNGDVELDDVFVPEERRLPGAQGFSSTTETLAASRVMVVWQPLGAAWGLYDVCLKYLSERKQFGQPLVASQLVQAKLMSMLGHCQAMALLAWRVTRRHERGMVGAPEAGLAKAWCTQRGRECAALARELMGGNGMLSHFHVAKAFADMEAFYTYEGTFDINLLLAGGAATGVAAIRPAGSTKSRL